MIHYVLCARQACKTGRAIAKAISARQGAPCWFYCRRSPRQTRRVRNYLRYGDTRPGIASHHCVNTLNSFTSDKLGALQTMQANGVRTPELNPTSGLRIWRKRHRCHASDNPVISEDNQTGFDYCLRFIPARREYRILVCDGKVIRRQYKYAREGATGDIRTDNRGFGLKSTSVVNPDVDAQAIGAVGALGYRFGAVDIIVGRDSLAYVLEVNSAPGLNDNGVTTLVEALLC